MWEQTSRLPQKGWCRDEMKDEWELWITLTWWQSYSILSCAQENACLGVTRVQYTVLTVRHFPFCWAPWPYRGYAHSTPLSLSWPHPQKHFHWLPKLFTDLEGESRLTFRYSHQGLYENEPHPPTKHMSSWQAERHMAGQWDDRHCLLPVL